MEHNAIELSGVTKRYADFTQAPVNLKLPGGAILGLIGENGAGKTTLIKTILGVARPDGGTVRLLARYLTVLLALAFSAVLCGLFGAALAALGQMEDWGLYLSSAIGALGFSVLLNAILLPLLYRFGAERARILFFGVLGAIVAIGFTVLSLVDVTGWLDGIEHVQWKGMLPVVGVAAIAAAVVLLLSYVLSVRIYQKREL